jgi:hypothetical protein
MARQRGVVVSVTNFYDEYLAKMSELKNVPYFEGDYWTGCVEQKFDGLKEKGEVCFFLLLGHMGLKQAEPVLYWYFSYL